MAAGCFLGLGCVGVSYSETIWGLSSDKSSEMGLVHKSIERLFGSSLEFSTGIAYLTPTADSETG